MKTIDLANYVPAFVPDVYAPSRPEESFWQRVANAISSWEERSRQRRALAELTDEQLDDIGVTYAEAKAEAAKHFWQA